MSIDPSIPLSLQPVQIPNAFAAFQQVAQLRAQQEQARAIAEERQAIAEQRRAQTAKLRSDAEKEAAGNAALDDLFANYKPGQPIPTGPVSTLYRAFGPEKTAAIVKGVADMGNTDLTTADNLRKSMTTRLLAIEALPEARRAAAWNVVAQDYIQRGVVKPDEVPAYSPETLQYYKNSLLSPDKRYDVEHPKPVTVAPGSSLVNPSSGQAVFTAPERPSLQSKDVMLDGKRAMVNFDPRTGKYTDASSGQDVSTRVAPIPPASLILNDQRRQGATMPDFALTDARPVGADGNRPDPTIRMTPNGLYQAAQTYIATGSYPPTGRGTDPISVAQREAINAKVGAIAAAAGMDVPTLRAFYKSNSSSLTALQKSADSVQQFMATADKNADLLRETLKKVPDTGVPLFNQPLRSFATNVSGDPNMAKMATYLQSVQNEYARIIAQPNLSGQLTDSARHEAEALLSPKATVKQMLASIEALQTEGTNRMVSIGEQIQRVAGRMNGAGGGVPQPPQPAPSAAPVGRYNPATGKVEPIRGGGL